MAVTFDYWSTLVHEAPGQLLGLRRSAWMARLGAAGVELAEEVLDRAFEGNWGRYVEHWTTNRQYLAEQAAHDLLVDVGLSDLEDELRDALVEDFVSVGTTAELELTPNVAECLRTLHAAGLRLGIICDVGMTPSPILRHHLQRQGVLELFDHWSFSDEVGTYKPDPRIFDHALFGLGGIDPRAAAHVGDIRRTDVAGAQGAGLLAVRYRAINDDESDGPEGDIVCDDHAQLPALLGL